MVGGSDAKVLVTGRRTNIFDYNMRFITKDVHESDINIERAAQSGVLFREDALVGFCAIAHFQDYFIFTKTTYFWDQIPNLVIGRPLYDNYLLHIVSKNRFTDLVDATPSSPLSCATSRCSSGCSPDGRGWYICGT